MIFTKTTKSISTTILVSVANPEQQWGKKKYSDKKKSTQKNDSNNKGLQCKGGEETEGIVRPSPLIPIHQTRLAIGEGEGTK